MYIRVHSLYLTFFHTPLSALMKEGRKDWKISSVLPKYKNCEPISPTLKKYKLAAAINKHHKQIIDLVYYLT